MLQGMVVLQFVGQMAVGAVFKYQATVAVGSADKAAIFIVGKGAGFAVWCFFLEQAAHRVTHELRGIVFRFTGAFQVGG